MKRMLAGIARATRRRRTAASMRKGGMTVQAIGNALGISKQRVSQMLKEHARARGKRSFT